jgi:LAS superfamily LD-carboxypeptidase LdcB
MLQYGHMNKDFLLASILAACIILAMSIHQSSAIYAKEFSTWNITLHENIEELDHYSDASIYKYIGREVPFNNAFYEPADLINITDTYTSIRTQDPRLRAQAAYSYEQLAQAFFEEFDYKIYLISAYRSYKNQHKLINEGCSRHRCASAGASEHQAGLAIDIHVANNRWGILVSLSNTSSPYYQRLAHNAHKFGRHNSLQKGKEIDGYMAEWRHRRYLGVPLASYLYEHNLSFPQYYQQLQKSWS